MRDNFLIAHRGWRERYPENSLAAIEGAIAAGAQHIEVDVMLTRDRIPVLFHDTTLERLCGRSGAVHDHLASELFHTPLREPERLGPEQQSAFMTLRQLADMLSQHPAITGYIEIKPQAIEQFGVTACFELIDDALQPAAAQCMIISESLPLLQHIRHHSSYPVAVVVESWQQLQDPALIALQPDLLFVDHLQLPPDADPHSLAWPLAVYEVGDWAHAKSLFERGVRYVETFLIGELIEAARLDSTDSFDRGECDRIENNTNTLKGIAINETILPT